MSLFGEGGGGHLDEQALEVGGMPPATMAEELALHAARERRIQEINDLLESPIAEGEIITRPGPSGVRLSYVDQYYVIHTLCEIFGGLGWSSETLSCELVKERELNIKGKRKWEVIYRSTVRLSAHGCVKAGTAIGSGFSPSLKDAHHAAATEAETDALKRAARLLGDHLGLALYDKRRRGVDKAPQRQQQQRRPQQQRQQRPPQQRNGGNQRPPSDGQSQGQGRRVVVEGTIYKAQARTSQKGSIYVKGEVETEYGKITVIVFGLREAPSDGCTVRAVGVLEKDVYQGQDRGWKICPKREDFTVTSGGDTSNNQDRGPGWDEDFGDDDIPF